MLQFFKSTSGNSVMSRQTGGSVDDPRPIALISFDLNVGST